MTTQAMKIEYGTHPAPLGLSLVVSVVDHVRFRGQRYDGLAVSWTRAESGLWYSRSAYRVLLGPCADSQDPFLLRFVDQFLAPHEVLELRRYLGQVAPTIELDVQEASLPIPWRFHTDRTYGAVSRWTTSTGPTSSSSGSTTTIP